MKQLHKISQKLLICIFAIAFSAVCGKAADFNSTLDLANKGDTVAIGEVAVMYCKGEGVQKNYQEALKWAEKGIAMGNSDAMYVMGYLYQHGGAVKADIKKAYEWYYKAAAQGNAVAMNAIGLMYYNDNKYGEAEKWYVRATDFNYTPAEQNLTILRTRGTAVTSFLQYKDKYDEEFDRTLAKNLAKQRKARDAAKWAMIGGDGPQTAKTPVSIFDAAGFDISDKVKSNDGYLVISKVKNGSVAESLGMLTGSDLYQIDNMNTKQCSAQEIRSYIGKQQEAGATILVIFMAEDGSPKRVDIKLR